MTDRLRKYYFALIATTFLFGLTSTVTAEELRFQAVWHQGSGTNLVTPPESRADFVSRGEAMTQVGHRLIDLETIKVDGKRVYSGVWVSGTGSNLFAGPMGPVDLREQMTKRREQGLRVVDFEIDRRSNGGRLYWAVWQPGTGSERVSRPVPLNEFMALGERLTRQEGLRLLDFEMERVDGRRLYSGLWREGTGSNLFVSPRRPAAFREAIDDMRRQDLELVDFERFGRFGNRRFAGVFSSGNGEGRISAAADFDNFVQAGTQLTGEGLRTQDLEFFVVGQAGAEPTSNPGNPPVAGADDSALPDLPPWIQLTGNRSLRIEWGIMVDTGNGHEVPRMTIPAFALPDYLPRKNKEQDVVFPEHFCGMNITMVDQISWHQQGQIIDQQPFNHVPSVSAIQFDPEFGNQNFLQAGIEFSGPVGGCEGSDHGWSFPIPITQTGPFNVQELANLELVLDLMPDATIRFIEHQPPEAEFTDAHELYDDETFNHMIHMAHAFLLNTQIDNGYCGIDQYLSHICEEEGRNDPKCIVGEEFEQVSPC